ncbi:MAG: staygreen family protein, partial [Promethearchaeota archaeon]
MSTLKKEKLHVSSKQSLESDKDFIPRKYTLTHSDSTGDLYLTIDCEYDQNQISSLYTRFMRD